MALPGGRNANKFQEPESLKDIFRVALEFGAYKMFM
jgi:hypothetical protein